MSVSAQSCTSLDIGPNGICLTIPGGGTFCVAFPSAGIPSNIAVTKQLLAQANSALAPLMPVFQLIDVLTSILTSFPPDLTALLTLLANLIAPIPLMAAQILDAVIAFLTGILHQIEALIAEQALLLASATKAATLGNARLSLHIDCANAQIAAQMTSMNEGMMPINAAIGLLNLFLPKVGGPSIPTCSTFGTTPAAALAPLQTTIDTLTALRANPFFP